MVPRPYLLPFSALHDSIFTLGLSVLFLKEKVGWWKLFGVVFTCVSPGCASPLHPLFLSLSNLQPSAPCLVPGPSVPCSVLGAVLVASSGDSGGDDGPENTVWGDVVCLISAVFYGAYTTAVSDSSVC